MARHVTVLLLLLNVSAVIVRGGAAAFGLLPLGWTECAFAGGCWLLAGLVFILV